MHEFDTAIHDELRSLRERAYGPAADIDQDPAAAQRLRELEARAAVADAATPRAQPEPTPPRRAEPVPSAPPTATPAPPQVAAAAPAPAETPVAEPEPAANAEAKHPDPAPRLSRVTKALWALSVVAAAAAAAAVTFSLTYITPVSMGGATQVASLDETTAITVPPGFMGAGQSSRVFEYLGYTVFEAIGTFSYTPSQSTDCFVVMATAAIPEDFDPQQGWSYDSPMYSGCRAGAYPAITQFVVDSSAPEATRARFPDGTALRFVFDGDTVGVFVDQE